ncbi:unnamed protein product, partial [Phaeothamnion confervicola]
AVATAAAAAAVAASGGGSSAKGGARAMEAMAAGSAAPAATPSAPQAKRLRRNVAAMSEEEKREWAREQNREHSRLSRARRKEREQQLMSDATRLRVFRTLLDELPDLVSLHSDGTHDLMFLYANAAFQRLLGHHPAALMGRPLLDVVHRDDAEVAR